MRWFGRFHFGGGVGSAVAGIGVILWAIAVYLHDSEGGIQAVKVGGIIMLLVCLFWAGGLFYLGTPVKGKSLKPWREKQFMGLYAVVVAFLLVSHLTTPRDSDQRLWIWFALMLLVGGSFVFAGTLEMRRDRSLNHTGDGSAA